jgi:glycosyltransferase involved in cell wall biosynthesis
MGGINGKRVRSAGALPGRPEKASIVIPAYNEEARISAVLEVLLRLPQVERITVVDDGSTDRTAEVVGSFLRRDSRLRLLRLKGNRGKGAALAAGARASPTDLVVFLDADLLGLRPLHVEELLRPVRDRGFQMSLGVFSGGREATDLPLWITPGLTGQRCLRWSRFRGIRGLESARYGAEVALNRHARRSGCQVRKVAWKGVSHRTKYEKRGVLRGFGGYVRMYLEVLRQVLSETEERSAGAPASFRLGGRPIAAPAGRRSPYAPASRRLRRAGDW